MWLSRKKKFDEISIALGSFSKQKHQLLGIKEDQARATLAWQMIASLRRLEFTQINRQRDIHPDRANPNSNLFDPEKAAAYHARKGRIDEAIWIVFLSIHFGKHRKHGWRLLKDVYSGLGKQMWTWDVVSLDPKKFRIWLKLSNGKLGGAFGNHRKYESLDADKDQGTASVVESAVACFGKSPANWFSELVRAEGNDPGKIFDAAYKKLNIVRFGRLAKFDFLCLLGRLDLAPIAPGSAYLDGATGPLKGARLLIEGQSQAKLNAKQIQGILSQLDEILGVGMQVMEDSLCNWQKSPSKFIHFLG